MSPEVSLHVPQTDASRTRADTYVTCTGKGREGEEETATIFRQERKRTLRHTAPSGPRDRTQTAPQPHAEPQPAACPAPAPALRQGAEHRPAAGAAPAPRAPAAGKGKGGTRGGAAALSSCIAEGPPPLPSPQRAGAGGTIPAGASCLPSAGAKPAPWGLLGTFGARAPGARCPFVAERWFLSGGATVTPGVGRGCAGDERPRREQRLAAAGRGLPSGWG